MSNTGGFWNGQPALTMYAVLLQAPAPRDREGFIEHGVEMFTKIGGSRLRARHRGPARRSPRAATTAATTRAARSASCGRSSPTATAAPDLRRLRLPATVIHGAEDKLVRPSGGRATAKAIPGAKLVEIAGMGHGLPRGAWPVILGAIDETARRGPTPAAGSARRPAAACRITPPVIALALPLTRPVARVRLGRASAGPRAARRPSRRHRHTAAPARCRSARPSRCRGARGAGGRRRETPAASYSFSRAATCSTVPAIQRRRVRLRARPGLQRGHAALVVGLRRRRSPRRS